MNHRRRFPRTPSDAHLTTPPDTRPFTCERRHEEDVSCTSFAQMLAAEFGFKDCPPIPFAETSRHLLQNGHATRIDGQDTDFTLTPDTLASLVFGRLTATEAAAAGLLENIRNADSLARWNEVLRLAHPPHEAEHTW